MNKDDIPGRTPEHTTPKKSRPAEHLRPLLYAVTAAIVIAVMIVLPAEHGVDPTRAGHLLGLTQMHEPQKTAPPALGDPLAGSDDFTQIEPPDAGDPTPLPNPNVFQKHSAPVRSETRTITLPGGSQTEIKLKLSSLQTVIFDWSTDGHAVYVDFHGHDPALGEDFWVRYEEGDEATSGNGSLIAPFPGEHGWYWLNYEETPVTITLNVAGYYDEIIDYGVSSNDLP